MKNLTVVKTHPPEKSPCVLFGELAASVSVYDNVESDRSERIFLKDMKLSST